MWWRYVCVCVCLCVCVRARVRMVVEVAVFLVVVMVAGGGCNGCSCGCGCNGCGVDGYCVRLTFPLESGGMQGWEGKSKTPPTPQRLDQPEDAKQEVRVHDVLEVIAAIAGERVVSNHIAIT